MKVFVIVEGIPGRYVSVKKTEDEAHELIKELKVNNKEMLGHELDYRILEQEI